MQMKNPETLKKLRGEFGPLPVVDAKEPLRLQPKRCDLVRAKQKDPTSCVFAKAAKRQFGATRVVFWKTSAYIDLTGKDGKRRVERFQVSKDMRGLIEKFDRGEPIDEGRAFILRAPIKSATMSANRRRAASRKSEQSKIIARAYTSKNNLKKKEKELAAARSALAELTSLAAPKPKKVQAAVTRVEKLTKFYHTAKRAFERTDKAAREAGGNIKYRGRKPQSLDLTVRSGKGNYHILAAN